MVALADAQLVGDCAHAAPAGSRAWRARFFAAAASTAEAIQLSLLDDVAVGGSALPSDAQVDVECVLPSGLSVELAVPATETIRAFKLRLHRVWSFTAPPAGEGNLGKADADAPCRENGDANADAPGSDSVACPGDGGAAAASKAAAPVAPSVPAAQAEPCAAPAEPQAAWTAAADTLSWALSGARLVGAWHPSTHLAALVAAVSILTALIGFLPICAAAVAVLYSRVHHEQRARLVAQAEVERMRAEVHAAHRQITATVAALARADEASCGIMNGRAADDGTTLWLNNAFAQCWTGWLSAWLSTTLAGAVSDGLRQRKPAGLDEWGLLSLELDDKPPRLSAPHILRSAAVDAEQTMLAFGLSIEGEVALRMRLTASVSLLRAKITLPVTFSASAADITVALAFIRTPPYVRTVRVSLLAIPRISAQVGKLSFTDIPGVDVAVQAALEGALRKMLVEPNGHVWDIETWWIAEQLKNQRNA